jgi:hypothetical protein
MPQQSLTMEKAIQEWWAKRPHRSTDELLKAISALERQYGTRLPSREKFKMLCEIPPEILKRSGRSTKFTAPTDIGEEAALKLCGQLLDAKHYDLLFDKTGMVVTPDREPLAILLKKSLPQELLNAARPVVRKAAHRKISAGNRGVAAGTGMQPRRRKDGTVGKIKGVPLLEDLSDEDYKRLGPARDGTWGFSSRSVRGGQVYPCRLTMYSGALPSELRVMSELATAVGESFRRSWVQDRWEAQFEKASNTPLAFLIRTPEGRTPFTTITCNNRWRTAAHIDKGDLKEGFGVLCCLGDFKGCELVFPRYRVAVRYEEGDVLLANVHHVHGNTPLLTPEGKVPLPGREPERLVCVFYYQETMDQCESTMEKELEFINRREKGDRMRKSKAKAKGAGK